MAVAMLAPAVAAASGVSLGEYLVVDRSTPPIAKGSVVHVSPGGVQVRHSVGDSDAVGTGFVEPSGLVLHPNGKLYVADQNASTSSLGAVFDVATGAHAEPAPGASGGAAQTLLSSAGSFSNPVNLAVTPDGNLYVVDKDSSIAGFAASSGAVIKVNVTTGVQTVISPKAGMPTANSFVDPSGIAVGADGYIYVADRNGPAATGSVIKVDPATGGQIVLTSGGSLSDPWSITMHPDGNLYVADSASFASGAVVRVSPAGAQTLIWSGPPFVDPQGIGVATNGDLLVADASAATSSLFRVTLSPASWVTVTSAGSLVDAAGVISTGSTTLASAMAGSVLTVTSTADDAFSVSCFGGNVRINGRPPDTGPAVCSSVSSIVVSGGPSANTIDLSNVGPGTFSAVTAISVDGGGGDDRIQGGAFGESLSGGAGIDQVLGGDGTDSIVVSDGSDTVDGQGGGDFVTVVFGLLAGAPVGVIDSGASGSDLLRIDGTAGPDAILASDFSVFRGAESISVGTGFESRNIWGLGDADTLDAAAASTVPYALLGGAGNDILTGGAGPDLLDGEGDDDTLTAGFGNDFLQAASGNDSMNGGEGSDTHKVWTTAGTVAVADTGFIGTDYVKFYGSTGGDTITLTPGAATGGTMSATYTGIDGWIVVYADDDASGGSAGPGGNDVIDATTLTVATQLFGQAGDDTLIGGSGSDGLNGGDGTDSLSGGAGTDTLNGGLGPDTLSGGGAVDTVGYSARTTPVTVTADGALANDGEAGEGDNVAADVENLIGGTSSDTLSGNSLANTLTGGGGSDTLNGLLGNDQLIGGAGGDALNGGGGIDIVTYVTSSVGVTVTAGDTTANDGAPGELDNVASDVEKIYGSNFADSITGNGLANLLYGLNGPDFLDGGPGNDSLDGGPGADGLVGGGDIDIVSYWNRTTAVFVSADGIPGDGEFFGAEGDNVGFDIETIYGSPFGDEIHGSSIVNTLYGLDGDDTLVGEGGADYLYGGSGSDWLKGFNGVLEHLYCGNDFDLAERDTGLDVVSPDCEALIP